MWLVKCAEMWRLVGGGVCAGAEVRRPLAQAAGRIVQAVQETDIRRPG